MHNKGDAYIINCNVTGSDEGTSDKPMFSLLALFSENVFPKIEGLVGLGHKYEGFLPVSSDDNMIVLFQFCCECLIQKGWQWELQALQMPHMIIWIVQSSQPC